MKITGSRGRFLDRWVIYRRAVDCSLIYIESNVEGEYEAFSLAVRRYRGINSSNGVKYGSSRHHYDNQYRTEFGKCRHEHQFGHNRFK